MYCCFVSRFIWQCIYTRQSYDFLHLCCRLTFDRFEITLAHVSSCQWTLFCSDLGFKISQVANRMYIYRINVGFHITATGLISRIDAFISIRWCSRHQFILLAALFGSRFIFMGTHAFCSLNLYFWLRSNPRFVLFPKNFTLSYL